MKGSRTSNPKAEVREFQSRGPEQGRQFDAQCRIVLQSLGFRVSKKQFRVPEVGIEIDAQLLGRCSSYWVEFKGSWCGRRPGLLRTDTVKKAVANAYLLHHAEEAYPPYIILTSHLPQPGSAADKMLGAALATGAVAGVFCLNNPSDVRCLGKLVDQSYPKRGKTFTS